MPGKPDAKQRLDDGEDRAVPVPYKKLDPTRFLFNKLNRSFPWWKGLYKVADATSHCIKVCIKVWLTDDKLRN